MGIDIDTSTPTPEADVGSQNRDPLNPDTYEPGDDNGNNTVQN